MEMFISGPAKIQTTRESAFNSRVINMFIGKRQDIAIILSDMKVFRIQLTTKITVADSNSSI